ncbi:MAG: chromosome partitioning protein ParA [Thiopseudomonas sp.]|nr:chromosome partitioning protein ParA [Thiopseudomonas sp.]MCK9466018.1 chromosome partitioning protein ParA [Thiopseudomonas sp.]
MRVQKSSKAQLVEAIMLFGSDGVAVEMLYPEFEAILDNMVNMPQYADEQVRAAYVLISPRLLVRSIVFFYLDFDEEGAVEPGWNLDLRHLAEKAGAGPDLGAGPIRLACRSQCAVPWYQMHLWDPELSPGKNHVNMVRDAVKQNNLRLVMDIEEDLVVTPGRLQVAQEDSWQNQEQVQEVLHKAQEREKEQRHQAAQLIKQQRLRIHTLEAQHTETLAKLRQQYELALAQRDRSEKQLMQQLGQYREQNDTLKLHLSEQSEKLREIRKDVQVRIQELNEREQQQVGLLRTQYENELQARIETLTAQHQEHLQAREDELATKHECLQQAVFEQERLQRTVKDLTAQTGEKILQRLNVAGINFVALHPGVGHINIPLSEIDVYLQNPICYAAKQCLVTEEHYREWLKHYESAACDALIETTDTLCCLPLERKSHPSQFVAGISNKCSRHRKLVKPVSSQE